MLLLLFMSFSGVMVVVIKVVTVIWGMVVDQEGATVVEDPKEDGDTKAGEGMIILNFILSALW